MANVHKNDVGTAFDFTVIDDSDGGVVDLSLCPTREATFVKPDGTVLGPKTCTLITDGTDGRMRYVTIAGDIDQSGSWKVQGRAAIDAARSWYSDLVRFLVLPNAS